MPKILYCFDQGVNTYVVFSHNGKRYTRLCKWFTGNSWCYKFKGQTYVFEAKRLY